MARDEFPPNVIEALSKRVASRCSNPDCGRVTSGPHSSAGKYVNLGVAAHITAASQGGARYDPNITSERRKSAENGIWLCQNCAKLVDNDPVTYPDSLLREWKKNKEKETEELISANAPDHSGELVHVSKPLAIGSVPYGNFEGQKYPLAQMEGPGEDPAFYASALVFRVILKTISPAVPVMVQAICAEVLDVSPVPAYQPLMGAYPTGLSLYRLEFDDPKQARTN